MSTIRQTVHKVPIFYTFLYLIFVFVLAYTSFKCGAYDGDTLFYAALAASADEADPVILHKKIHECAERELPREKYLALIGSIDGSPPDTSHDKSAYRWDMATNWQHFNQQLPFYRMRVLYIELTRILYKIGIPVVQATLMVSVLSYVSLACLIFVWLQSLFPKLWGFLFSVLLIGLPPLLLVARNSTPDALLTFLFVLSIYFWIERKKPIASCAIMLLSILARTDNLPLALILFTAIYVFQQAKNARALMNYLFFSVSACLLSFLLVKGTGHYGWESVIGHSFIQYNHTPAETAVRITFDTYMKVCGRELLLLKTGYFTLFAFLGLLTLYVQGFKPSFKFIQQSQITQLLIVLALGGFSHFVIFPALWDRFFVSYYITIALLLLKSVSESVRHKERLLTNS